MTNNGGLSCNSVCKRTVKRFSGIFLSFSKDLFHVTRESGEMGVKTLSIIFNV
jgi:hypothetical protein